MPTYTTKYAVGDHIWFSNVARYYKSPADFGLYSIKEIRIDEDEILYVVEFGWDGDVETVSDELASSDKDEAIKLYKDWFLMYYGKERYDIVKWS